MLLLEVFLPHVDHADQRELTIIYPGGQTGEPIFSCLGVLVALQRGGRTAEQNCTTINLSSDNGQIAGVIARCFFLFVGGLVFFVDHDQTKTLNRREDSASGADRHACSAAVEFVPLIMTLACREMAVEHSDQIRLEAHLKALDGLWCQ